LRRDVPIKSDSDEGKDAGRYCTWCAELRKDAPRIAESPVVVQQIDEVKHRVEGGLQAVGQRQIDEEVVRYAAHASMSDYDPDDDSVASNGDDEHRDKRRRVEQLYVPRQHVRVASDRRRRRSITS